MGASSNVSSGAKATATQYNNLRKDVVDTTSGHDHDGINSKKVEKLVYIKVLANDTAVETGDGKAYFTIPDALNGMNLVDADAAIYTQSSSGNPTIAIYNVTDSCDMLSTSITIDGGGTEKNSYTAATPPVIDGAHDDVSTGDIIRIDCDVSGTGTKGLDVILTFALP